MGRHLPGASLQALQQHRQEKVWRCEKYLPHLVGEGLKPEPGAVVRGRLLGIADPPLNVVELEKPSAVWLGPLVSVSRPDGSLTRIWSRHLSLASAPLRD